MTLPDWLLTVALEASKFDEQSVFSTVLGPTSRWGYKHYNKYASQKIVNLSNTIKIHLKADVVDVLVVNALR